MLPRATPPARSYKYLPPADGNRFVRGVLAPADGYVVPFYDTDAGFWGDADEPGEVFTTTGATTEALLPGDLVGLIRPIAGAVELSQSNSVNRVYKTKLPKSGLRALNINNMMTGLVPGITGIMPNDWAAPTVQHGLTRTIGANVVESGITCASLQYAGTATSTNNITISMCGSTTCRATAGQQVTGSFYLKLQGGALPNFINKTIHEFDSSGVFLRSTDVATSATGTLTRITQTITCGASTAFVRLICFFGYVNTGVVNVTLLFGKPQLELGSTATNAQDVYSAYDVTETGQHSMPSMFYYNGSAWLTTLVQSYGGASLYADAGQAWAVFFAFRSTSTSANVILAKASGAATTSRTFQVTATGGSTLSIILRGSTTDFTSVAYSDGGVRIGGVVWTGSVANVYVDGVLIGTASVGAAAEEAQNITVGCRTESAPANFFTGHMSPPLLLNYAPSAAQIQQQMAFMRAAYQP